MLTWFPRQSWAQSAKPGIKRCVFHRQFEGDFRLSSFFILRNHLHLQLQDRHPTILWRIAIAKASSAVRMQSQKLAERNNLYTVHLQVISDWQYDVDYGAHIVSSCHVSTRWHKPFFHISLDPWVSEHASTVFLQGSAIGAWRGHTWSHCWRYSPQ